MLADRWLTGAEMSMLIMASRSGDASRIIERRHADESPRYTQLMDALTGRTDADTEVTAALDGLRIAAGGHHQVQD